jgi:hypothetical protein
MRPWLLLLVLLARPASAGIEASWNACAPIVSDRVLPSGATTSRLYFSVTGLTGTVKGFDIRFSYGSQFAGDCGALHPPDAWRFDDAGCEGLANLVQFKTTSTDPACPQLTGPVGLDLTKINYDPLIGRERIIIARSWTTPITADPGIRYQIANVTFDHTYAVSGPGDPPQTCGGFEQPICFTFQGSQGAHGDCDPYGQNAYLDGNGEQHSFGAFPSVIATFRSDASSVTCNGATPATPKTWGALRAQYR